MVLIMCMLICLPNLEFSSGRPVSSLTIPLTYKEATDVDNAQSAACAPDARDTSSAAAACQKSECCSERFVTATAEVKVKRLQS